MPGLEIDFCVYGQGRQKLLFWGWEHWNKYRGEQRYPVTFYGWHYKKGLRDGQTVT